MSVWSAGPLRIVILSQFCEPEPVLKGVAFAKRLQAAGHSVEVVTGFPNYPGGKIYPGYRLRLYQREEEGGIRLTRLPLFPSHDASVLNRALNYASFFFSVLVYGLFFLRKADVLYAYHPPVTVGFATAIISAFRRIPFVYDIQDLWPDSLVATGMMKDSVAMSLIRRMCHVVYSGASQIAVNSPGIKRELIERGVREEKISAILNWCDEEALASAKPVSCSLLPKGFNVLFAGNIGPAQALPVILEVAGKVSSHERTINFVFLGSGIDLDQLKGEATARKLKNVHFLPRVPFEEVGGLLTAADVLLVHLKRNELFRITIPSKIQAYMAIGRPILAAVDGDAALLVEESGAGVSARSEDPASIAQAVEELASRSKEDLATLGDNGRKFYHERLSASVATEKFLEIFRRAVNGPRA